MNLQLARQLADTDPEAAKALIDQMGRDVQQALDETGRLASRIYPPLIEAGGLAAALRAAAASAGVRTSIDVTPDTRFPPEVAGAVYFCCVGVLERSGSGARATITVTEANGAVVFEATTSGARAEAAASDGLVTGARDRVEALGGRLTPLSKRAGATGLSGSLPLSR